MKPISQINLCNVPRLDTNYDNTYRFTTREKQQEYFIKHTVFRLIDYSYLRKDNSIKVKINVDDIDYANYLFYKNDKGKIYYCFILDKVYINENTTEIFITTDIMQTYQFDYVVLDSFVDRCHVDRWSNTGDPTNEFEIESIETGDLIQTGKTTIFEYKDNYLMVSSTPLGIINKNSDSGGDGGDGGNGGGGGGNIGGGGDYKNGIPSTKLMRFLKGFEGFGKYLYKDSGGLNTIGYGITQGGNASAYNDMVANQPVSEQKASEYMWQELGKRGKNYQAKILKYASNQNQFDALLDLAYNGVPSIMNEDNSLWVALRTNKDESYVRPIWEKYYISDGQNQQEGLKLRRIQECNMFYGHNVEMRAIPIIVGTGQYNGTVKENNGNGYLPS